MYLYGASGHAKVIIDILRANNEPIEALFDDNEKIHTLFFHGKSIFISTTSYF